jgi:hypothetical protein
MGYNYLADRSAITGGPIDPAGPGGALIDLPTETVGDLPEARVDFDDATGHTHEGAGATGTKVAHSDLDGLAVGDDHPQYQEEDEKGVASGYASLDATTKIPSAQLPQATETVVGAAEVATQAEVNTGTDDTRMVTPAKLRSAIGALGGLSYVKVAIGLTALTTTGVIPDNVIIRDVVLEVTTGYSGGTMLSAKRAGDATKVLFDSTDVVETSVGLYEIPQAQNWGAIGSGAVAVTVAGAPGAGASILYIGYTMPLDIT